MNATSVQDYLSLLEHRAMLIERQKGLLLEQRRLLEHQKALLKERQRFLEQWKALFSVTTETRAVDPSVMLESLSEQHKVLLLSHETAVKIFKWLVEHSERLRSEVVAR